MEKTEDHGVQFVTLYGRIIHELTKNPRIAQKNLACRLDVTMRTVQRHIIELEREGYIRVARERKPYTYEVAWDRRLPYFEQLTVRIFDPKMQNLLYIRR